ncbi:MAG: flagellar protein, partial [Treponema sp.]|nr:flagellar protein [Treponema sp.]
KAELTTERDIADEDLWGIVTKKEAARQKLQMQRFGNKQVNRYIERAKMATQEEFTKSIEADDQQNAGSYDN